ncbi:FxLYD domain-containing protein [Jeotgalibacillus proteolyticus]|uniref:Uncharacterized protein n=1 Tax=Jeotgalibacillus proteolyticus TaxID=2082395 RepID=A0A2S5GCH4_9BACL|nr:FxLYD domain-containing protein [Jeotgalibacillus proteolyticus]PPA70648.1 hypothetical protein C4B60_07560 [Jeotgalibacillus proteolyticus]
MSGHHQENEKRSQKRLSASSARVDTPIKMLGIVFLSCVLFVISIYAFESWRNKQVLDWKAQAETDAFNTDWNEAEDKLIRANQLRPSVIGVEESLSAVQEAKELEADLRKLSAHLDSGQMNQAEFVMEQIIDKVKASDNNLYYLFEEDILEGRDKLLVLKVEDDIKNPLSMQSLARKLLEISDVKGEYSDKAREQVKNKIAEAAIEEAKKELNAVEFSQALNIVEIGMGYTENHEDLEAFKKEIEAERLAYQTAEYDRMQEAMEEAEKEDIYNRTEAVTLKEWGVNAPSPGVIELAGKVENQGSRAIQEIFITWRIYTDQGVLVEERTVGVKPEILPRNAEGEFNDSFLFEAAEAKVEITNITWSLE